VLEIVTGQKAVELGEGGSMSARRSRPMR
jgi:hypothetical protein